MEGYLCDVAQIFSGVGGEDPRLDILDKIEFHISWHIRAYAWEDSPPDRVLPVTIKLPHECWQHLRWVCISSDYFRPALPYVIPPLLDRKIWQGRQGHAFGPLQAGGHSFFHQLPSPYIIWHTPIQSPMGHLCGPRLKWPEELSLWGVHQTCTLRPPTRLRRVMHPLQGGIPPYTRWPPPTTRSVMSKWKIYGTTSPAQLLYIPSTPPAPTWGYSLGVQPEKISAWSLRSSGAMALLLGNIDAGTIRIIGRWRSDKMMHYLHNTVQNLM